MAVKKKIEAKKRGPGKPPINDPDDAAAIQKKIDAYFGECEDKETRPTYCGLALALDYDSRQRLWEHARAGEKISGPIRSAMLRIEERYEAMLGITTSAGPIFALKNRGWKDTEDNTNSAQLLAMLDKVLERIK